MVLFDMARVLVKCTRTRATSRQPNDLSEELHQAPGRSVDVLAPGGWLVWNDFNSPVPWVKVREAIERIGFAEQVVHIAGTEVAF
jgi:hypothetical protein